MADPSYPTDLLYHPEHDWARIEGEGATFGITWFAQEALGEVVFFEAPALARRDERRVVRRVGVSQGGLRRGRAAVRRGDAVNEALSDRPEAINEEPYGEGWLVRVRLSDPGEGSADEPSDSRRAWATRRLD